MWKDLIALWKLAKSYLKGKKGAIFLGLFTSIIFSLTSLATPYLTKFLIDIIFHANRGDLLLPLLIICGVILIILFFCYGVSSCSEEQVFSAANKAGAYEFIIQLPEGFRTRIGGRRVPAI